MTFLPTTPQLARALAERSYTEPTPVQTAVLADAAAGRDLLVSAQTGSGKTVAYGLSIATNLLGDAERFERGRQARGLDRRADARARLAGAARAGVALSIHRRAHRLLRRRHGPAQASSASLRPARTSSSARRGGCCDHLERGNLDVSELKAVVLDEADEMLDLGFREDLETILETTPDARRTLLFSATLPRAIVDAGQAVSEGRVAHRGRGRRRRPRRHRVPRHPRRPARHRARGRQRAALFRIARRPRVLQHARGGPASCRRRCWSAASPWWRCRAS